MARKTIEELQEIKNKFNVDKLWSHSKLNTYATSTYEYFLKYMLHITADRDNSAYAPYGTCAHQILEDYYSNKISYEKMPESLEEALLLLELADIKFDRTDENKNESVKKKYIYDLKHFFKNHTIIAHKVVLEQFVAVKIGSHVFQCYLDCVYKDNNGYYNIVDFKSSSIYKGKKIEKEQKQLLLYAVGLNQMGVPIDKIKVCWNFLKYCAVQIEQANGEFTVRNIERYKLGKELKSNCGMWIKKLGYADKVDYYIDTLVDSNDLSCLPDEVKKKYTVKDCCIYMPITKNILDNFKIEIIDTITEIEFKEEKYRQTLDEAVFYDDEKSVKEQSFYFSNLCGYSPKLHKPYGLYLEKYNAGENGNVFCDVGSDAEESADDMAWLKKI